MSNWSATSPEVPQSDPTTGGSNIIKRHKSWIWEHYERVFINGEHKATCKYCKKKLSATKGHGTTHLSEHLKRCPNCELDLGIIPGGSERRGGRPKAIKKDNFDQQVSRNLLGRTIIIHEYPLSIVEHIGLRDFLKSLEPRFQIISRSTIKRDILKLYDYEKKKTLDPLTLNTSRIALTTDM